MFTAFISLFLSLLYFSFLATPACADDFNIIGDSNFNEYRQATTISIGALPLVDEDSFSISYDSNLLNGYNTQEILAEFTLEDLIDMNYWRRVPDIADNVAGPPGTQIDITYFFFNQAGHDVEVSKIAIPFSKENLDEGNWLDVALASEPFPVYKGISLIFDYRNLTKWGLFKEYAGAGVIEEDLRGTTVLDTLTISDPIQVVDVEQVVVGNNIEMKVVVKNVGKEELQDLHFQHLTFSEDLNIPVSQEVVVEYVLEDVQDIGHFQIENPNEQRECSIYGIPRYKWVWIEGTTVLALRQDRRGWVMGSYIIPAQDSFCITRTPYTLTSPFLGYANTQVDDNMEGEQEKEEEEFEDEQEFLREELVTEDEGGEILGIQSEPNEDGGENKVFNTGERDGVVEDDFVLPKTGVIY